MLVAIDLEVIDNDQDFRNLDRLLFLFEEEQHEWYLDTTVKEFMERAWPKQLSDRHRKILEEIARKAYVSTANISKKEKREKTLVKITRDGGNSLVNSLLYLDDPVHIVVENETSDSLFLNRLFDIFPIHGNNIRKAKSRSQVTYYPAGGRTETVKTLKNLAKKKNAPYKPRTFVFIDSDKKYPEEPNDKSLQEIVDYCAAENIPLHVLYKREIENYLPKEVLKDNLPDELNDVLEEFNKLTPTQVDFFDLEKGFNNHQPSEDDPLFSEFSARKDPRYDVLRRGFHLSKVYIAKQELYKLVESTEFNAKNVNIRCSHQPDPDELLNLLLRIKNYL